MLNSGTLNVQTMGHINPKVLVRQLGLTGAGAELGIREYTYMYIYVYVYLFVYHRHYVGTIFPFSSLRTSKLRRSPKSY